MAPKGICPNPGTGEYYLTWQKGLYRYKQNKTKQKSHTHTQKNMYMLTVSLCYTKEINTAMQINYPSIKLNK